MKKLFVLGLACSLLAGCGTFAAEEDPVLMKLTDLEVRLEKVERLLDTQGLLSLQAQLTDVMEQNSELRGEVETLQFESSGAIDRLREAFQQLDARVQGGSAGFADNTGSFVPPTTPTINTVADREAYQQAFELLKASRYEEAASSFREFLGAYPDSSFADNAQYWLGESHYVRREFKIALGAFQTVLSRFPQSRKVPDATLKMGLCQYELGQQSQAKLTLTDVKNNYPGTSAARLATQRLQELYK